MNLSVYPRSPHLANHAARAAPRIPIDQPPRGERPSLLSAISGRTNTRIRRRRASRGVSPRFRSIRRFVAPSLEVEQQSEGAIASRADAPRLAFCHTTSKLRRSAFAGRSATMLATYRKLEPESPNRNWCAHSPLSLPYPPGGLIGCNHGGRDGCYPLRCGLSQHGLKRTFAMPLISVTRTHPVADPGRTAIFASMA